MKQKYFWFDLGGTLRRTKNGEVFINSPDNQEPFPGTQTAVEYFHAKGFKIVGITNQGGCAATDPATGHPRKSLDNAIVEQQVTLDLFPQMTKIMFCPTYDAPSYCYEVTRDSSILVPAPIGNSGGQISCRKPGHGMILASVRDDRGSVNWDESWMAGDRDEDLLCAAGAIVNFIWADIFRSYFGGETVEKLRNETKIIKWFEDLLEPSFQQKGRKKNV